MKIAHLTDSISNNGVTRLLLTLTEAMSSAGIDNRLLIFRTPENRILAEQFRCEIQSLIIPIDDSKPKLLKSKWDAFRAADICSLKLDAWAAENDIDFVFVHGRPILRFFKAKTAHAVVAHSTKSRMFLPGPLSPRRFLIRPRVRDIYSSQPIITVSEGIRQDFIHQFGIREDGVKTIYAPIDIDKIRRLATQDTSGIPERPYFVAAGSAVKVKRYDILIRAFARCGIDADLVILGEGRKTSEYRKLAKSLGIDERLRLPGYRANPYPFFKNALALVVSSDYEGLPTGILEALACGTPVVSTDCPSGPREVLLGGLSQYLVPVRDVGALAKTMARVATSPYDYPEMLFEKFKPGKVANAYYDFATQHI